LWKALVRAVREFLGLPAEAPNSVFDAIMLTEDVLFDDIGAGGEIEVTGDLYMSSDSVVNNVTSLVGDNWKRSTNWLAEVGTKSVNLMSFRQLVDTYGKYFEGMPEGNGFKRYFDAFTARNSAISRYMKEPESVSNEWTALETSNPEAALEVSRIGTEATMYRLSPATELNAAQLEALSDEKRSVYQDLRKRFKAMPEAAQRIYEDLRKYYADSAKQESQFLLAASLRGILTKGPGAPLTTQEFEAQFPMSRIQKMKDSQSIMDELEDLLPADEIGVVAGELERMSSLQSEGAGDYFPLMRYGDYVVYASKELASEQFTDRRDGVTRRKQLLDEDPTLDVGLKKNGDGSWTLTKTQKEFWMFENKSEAYAKQQELVSGYGDGVGSVQLRMDAAIQEAAITSNAGLNKILSNLSGNPAAQLAIKNFYLKSLSDQAFRKHELRRKNRKGVDYDLQHRNLANYLKQSAYHRAQLEHGWKMGESLQDIVDWSKSRRDTPDMSTVQLQRVIKSIQKRDGMTNEPDELGKWVRGNVNLTQFMMLTSPSYWMINATQPWLVTAPIMGGKHGIGSSYAALASAMRLVKGPLTGEAVNSWGGLKALGKDRTATNRAFNVIDQLFEHFDQSDHPQAQAYKTLIDTLRDQNIIDINVLTELREIGEGKQTSLSTRVLDASRILAHITEVNNRVITAIAAYQLEINNGESVGAATKYAADMVAQTQFDYSTANKPPLFQSGGPLKWVAPLLFQFMQWPQHMYALLIRNVAGSVRGETPEVRRQALKSLVGLLGTHAAVGGAVGMALQPIKWALGLTMMAFGDDDEPYTLANAINGRTFDNMVTEVMTDLFGPTFGGAAARGLPTLAGTDLSARMSMGTLYFVDLRGDSAESILGSLGASFGGATLNQYMNWGNALGKVAQGDVYRGVEQGMPKFLRDALRANRYYNEGLVNNAGDTVISTKDLSFWDTFLQGVGFSPDKVSKFYQGQAAVKGAQGYARDRRERIIRQFVDDGPTSTVMFDLREFNRQFPSLALTRSTLIRAARAQVEREARYKRFGANIDEREAADFAEYADPFR
jgi:hypothetical protein